MMGDEKGDGGAASSQRKSGTAPRASAGRFWNPVVLALPVLAAQGAAAATPPEPTSPPAAYAARCAACHGARLQGGSGPALVNPDMRGRSPASVKAQIKATMPLNAPGALSDAEYDALAGYIAALNSR